MRISVNGPRMTRKYFFCAAFMIIRASFMHILKIPDAFSVLVGLCFGYVLNG